MSELSHDQNSTRRNNRPAFAAELNTSLHPPQTAPTPNVSTSISQRDLSSKNSFLGWKLSAQEIAAYNKTIEKADSVHTVLSITATLSAAVYCASSLSFWSSMGAAAFTASVLTLQAGSLFLNRRKKLEAVTANIEGVEIIRSPELEKFAKELGIACPALIHDTNGKFRPGSHGHAETYTTKNGLIVLPKTELSHNDLVATLAHEISHFTNFKSGVANSFFDTLASSAVRATTFLGVFASQGGLTTTQGTTGAVVAGLVVSHIAASIFTVAMLVPSAYRSRKLEELIDLSAVSLTKDPQSYISMLEKLPDKPGILFRTHRDRKYRIEVVEKRFVTDATDQKK